MSQHDAEAAAQTIDHLLVAIHRNDGGRAELHLRNLRALSGDVLAALRYCRAREPEFDDELAAAARFLDAARFLLTVHAGHPWCPFMRSTVNAVGGTLLRACRRYSARVG